MRPRTQGRTMQLDADFLSATPILASLDIKNSVEFFVSRLGFTAVYVEQDVYGIVTRGKVSVHFWACSDRTIAEATACRLQVNGIEQLFAHCLAQKIVHPNAPLTHKPWGTREFGVLDPDGNLVTFYEINADPIKAQKATP